MHDAGYGHGLWATILEETGGSIGRSGLLCWGSEGRTEVEVAYLLDRQHRGRGMTPLWRDSVDEYGPAEVYAIRRSVPNSVGMDS